MSKQSSKMLDLDNPVDALAMILTLQAPARSEMEIVSTEGGFAVVFQVLGQRVLRLLSGATEQDRLSEAVEIYTKVTRPVRLDGAGVYAARSGEYLKIGRARFIQRRIQALNNANPEPVELLGVLSWNPDDEQELLWRMRAHKARGEWFHASSESLRLLLEMLVENLEREMAKP